VAREVGQDLAGVQREGAYAVFLSAPVEFDGKEDIGRLGLSVGDPAILGSPLEIDIVEVDAGNLMST
jgi:hypothetical protein